MKICTKIESVQKQWGKIKGSNFIEIKFLEVYYQNHPKIKHLFVMGTNMRLYAHIFKLSFNKTKNYLRHNPLINIFLKLISFDVLYLTNSFITNIPAFINDKKISLKQLLLAIEDNYSIIVIPDFLFENMEVDDNNYTKIEVEEEMVIHIKQKWNQLEDYISDLRKKYQKTMKGIIKSTSEIKIRQLTPEDLEEHAINIENLFTQVVKSSRFKGPKFNTRSFVSFVKQGFMRVDGYFLNDILIGFSSEIQKERNLYSYFVGFDKNLNQSTPIYGRILLENINTAIKLKKDSLILGRTANEYKSNFGAIAVKSFIYLKIQNTFLNIILRPVYSQIRINRWAQRNPFKKKTHLT
tara:strand:- start:72 stop:1127 length:1056 start_codon:yes stop_codon:yes gene_type:complete